MHLIFCIFSSLYLFVTYSSYGISSTFMSYRRLLIKDAKSAFISKIPESLKGRLIEHLVLFSKEKQPSIAWAVLQGKHSRKTIMFSRFTMLLIRRNEILPGRSAFNLFSLYGLYLNICFGRLQPLAIVDDEVGSSYCDAENDGVNLLWHPEVWI